MGQKSLLIEHTNGSVDVTLASDAFGLADIDALVSELRSNAETLTSGRSFCGTVVHDKIMYLR